MLASEAPPRQIIGHLLTIALAIPLMQFVIPGPLTARTIPGLPVQYPIALAA